MAHRRGLKPHPDQTPEGLPGGNSDAVGDGGDLAARIWKRYYSAPGVIMGRFQEMLSTRRGFQRGHRLPILEDIQRRWHRSGSSFPGGGSVLAYALSRPQGIVPSEPPNLAMNLRQGEGHISGPETLGLSMVKTRIERSEPVMNRAVSGSPDLTKGGDTAQRSVISEKTGGRDATTLDHEADRGNDVFPFHEGTFSGKSFQRKVASFEPLHTKPAAATRGAGGKRLSLSKFYSLEAAIVRRHAHRPFIQAAPHGMPARVRETETVASDTFSEAHIKKTSGSPSPKGDGPSLPAGVLSSPEIDIKGRSPQGIQEGAKRSSGYNNLEAAIVRRPRHSGRATLQRRPDSEALVHSKPAPEDQVPKIFPRTVSGDEYLSSPPLTSSGTVAGKPVADTPQGEGDIPPGRVVGVMESRVIKASGGQDLAASITARHRFTPSVQAGGQGVPMAGKGNPSVFAQPNLLQGDTRPAAISFRGQSSSARKTGEGHPGPAGEDIASFERAGQIPVHAHMNTGAMLLSRPLDTALPSAGKLRHGGEGSHEIHGIGGSVRIGAISAEGGRGPEKRFIQASPLTQTGRFSESTFIEQRAAVDATQTRQAGVTEGSQVDPEAMEELVDKVLHKLLLRLAVERERRGWERWL